MAECQSDRGEWGGICPDCGQKLPDPPKPLDYGRPCSRTSLELGHGWDGRPMPEHTDAVRRRWLGDRFTTKVPA